MNLHIFIHQNSTWFHRVRVHSGWKKLYCFAFLYDSMIWIGKIKQTHTWALYCMEVFLFCFFTLFCFRNRWYRYWFFALMRLLIIVLRIKLIKAVALVAAEYLFSKNIFGSCGSSCDVPQSGHYGNFLSKYFHFWNTPEILLQSLKNCKDDRTISLQFKGWRFFGEGWNSTISVVSLNHLIFWWDIIWVHMLHKKEKIVLKSDR